MYSPCRRCVTVARANAQQKKTKTSGICFDTGAGSNKCCAMGTSKAPPPIDASSESAPFQLFTSGLTRACAGRRGKQPCRMLCTSRSSPDVTATQTQKHRLNLIPQKRKQLRMEKKKKKESCRPDNNSENVSQFSFEKASKQDKC